MLSHKDDLHDELVCHPYEIGILLLWHTDEMLSPTYEIATDFMAYVLVSYPYDIGILLLCHTGEMLRPMYEIVTDLMSYGRIRKSSAWDRCIVAMSYGWGVTSYIRDYKNPLHFDVVDRYLRQMGDKTIPDEAPPSRRYRSTTIKVLWILCLVHQWTKRKVYFKVKTQEHRRCYSENARVCAKWQWNARDCVTGLHDRRSRECKSSNTSRVRFTVISHTRAFSLLSHT